MLARCKTSPYGIPFDDAGDCVQYQGFGYGIPDVGMSAYGLKADLSMPASGRPRIRCRRHCRRIKPLTNFCQPDLFAGMFLA